MSGRYNANKSEYEMILNVTTRNRTAMLLLEKLQLSDITIKKQVGKIYDLLQ